jgi:hypothetical protein
VWSFRAVVQGDGAGETRRSAGAMAAERVPDRNAADVKDGV